MADYRPRVSCRAQCKSQRRGNTQLSKLTWIAIPNNKNIFVSVNGQRQLTVDQVAAEVVALANRASTVAG